MKREDVTREIAEYIQNSFKQYTKRMGGTWAIPLIADDVKKRYGERVHLSTVYLFSNQDYNTVKTRENRKRSRRRKQNPLPGRAGLLSKKVPEINERDFSYEEFVESLGPVQSGGMTYLETDNKYVKVLLALDEIGRDVKGKQLSKILGFDVKKCLSILHYNGMTEHGSNIKHMITQTGKDYLRKMLIVT